RCGHQLTLEGQALFYLRHAPECPIREPSRRSGFSGPAASRSGETSDEPRHFDRGECAFAAAVQLIGHTGCRLLRMIYGEHLIDHRYTGFVSRSGDPSRRLACDVLEMRGVPLDHAAEAEDGIVPTGLRQAPGDGRNLKRPRHPGHVDLCRASIGESTLGPV